MSMAECLAPSVVDRFKPVHGRDPCPSARRPGRRLNQVELVDREERLGQRIVPAHSRPAHRLQDPVDVAAIAKLGCGVLAPVRVEDHAGNGSAASGHCHPQRRTPARPAGDRPAPSRSPGARTHRAPSPGTASPRTCVGRGQFATATASGQRLLAHVVQQDRAAVLIQRAPIGAGREKGDWRCGSVECTTQTKNKTYPVWAGEFIVDKYCTTQPDDGSGSSNGVDLTIRFKANDNVDAEQIAFVQTAQ